MTEIRNVQTVVRKALYRAIQDAPGNRLPLSKLWSSAIHEMRQALGETTFISRFVSRDQTWRQPYVDLSLEGKEPANGQFADDVALRLGWEFFSDLTYRSRTSQTLETARLCLADVPTASIVAAAEDFQLALHTELGADFTLSNDEAFSFLRGLTIHMRRSGAVAHPYVKAAIERGGAQKGPNYFAGQKALGLGNRGVLPAPNQRTSAAPRLPTLRSRAEGFQYVGRDNGANWYRAWSNRFFGKAAGGFGTHHTDIFRHAFEMLARHQIAECIATGGTDPIEAWALRPEAIIVTNKLTHLSCDRCGRRESLPAHEAAEFSHACLRIGCDGELLTDDAAEGQPHGSAYLKSVMDTARNHRVVAREHTGILETDDRRKLER